MKFLCHFSGKTRGVNGESEKLIHATLQKGYNEAPVVGVGEHKEACSAVVATQPCHLLGGVYKRCYKTCDYQCVLSVPAPL